MTTVDDERMPRLDRWLAKDRLYLDGLTVPGARLLEQRLQIRATAKRFVYFAIVPVLFCIGASIGTDALTRRTRLDAHVWWLALAILFEVAGCAGQLLLTRRKERQLASIAHIRVAPDDAVPLRRRIGLIRLIELALAIVNVPIVVLALVALHTAYPVIALYSALALLTVGISAAIAANELARGSLAVDEATLRVDDRWRAQGIYLAMVPLLFLCCVAHALVPDSAAQLHDLWLRTFVIWGGALLLPVIFLEALAQRRDNLQLGQPPRWFALLLADWWRSR